MLDKPIDLIRFQRHSTRAGADLGPVMAYWNSLRQGRVVPDRADLNPEALRPYLAQSGIVERTQAGGAKIRIAGRHLEQVMGMNMRGMPLRSLFALSHRSRLDAVVSEMFEGPKLLTLSLAAVFDAQPIASGHMALMPLADMQGTISRALMVLTPQSPPERIPCRFRIRHAHLALIDGTGDGPDPTGDPPRLRVIEGGLA